MKQDIENKVAALVGLPLWSSGRATDLQWFAFGARRRVTGFRGDSTEVGEYALHVQCAWRIVHGDTNVVGNRDLYYPADETAEPTDDFDWDHARSRRDRRIDALFETRSFVVERVEVGAAGSLRIVLDSGHALELFPHDSLPREHWRLFRPYEEEPHLVVTGAGLDG